MTKDEAVKYWQKSARQSIKIAEDTHKFKHYSWSLFFWQLTLEKTLKGVIVKKGKVPPPTHNLNQLAKMAGLKVSEEQSSWLKEITSFNLEARYDDYKFSFQKKATKSYTDKWIKICKEIYRWFKKHL